MTKEQFEKVEIYDTSNIDVVAFLKKDDIYNGWSLNFGNMNGGFPIKIFVYVFPTVEHAYIASAFGNNNEKCVGIQNCILREPSAMFAKRRFRQNASLKEYMRSDFDDSQWHYNFMLWLVWQKCQQHQSFSDILLKIPENYIIIENDSRHGECPLWGCNNTEANHNYRLKRKILKKECSASGCSKKEFSERCSKLRMDLMQTGIWIGKNIQGKILMECRKALLHNTEPDIDYVSLNNADIYMFGKKLEF